MNVRNVVRSHMRVSLMAHANGLTTRTIRLAAQIYKKIMRLRKAHSELRKCKGEKRGHGWDTIYQILSDEINLYRFSGQHFIFEQCLSAGSAGRYGFGDLVSVSSDCGYCYGFEACVGVSGVGIVGRSSFGACP